jgi:hypothetical protein
MGSTCARERESGRWIVQDLLLELFLALFLGLFLAQFLELFPVGFVSRETQQMSTKPTYAMAAISGTEGRSEILHLQG